MGVVARDTEDTIIGKTIDIMPVYSADFGTIGYDDKVVT